MSIFYGHDGYPCLIGEMSANHHNDPEEIKSLIDMALEAGVDWLKIQSYTADGITLNSGKPEFLISEGLWAGRSLYELYEEGELRADLQRLIFELCQKKNINIFSSPFDSKAVENLEDLGCRAYKVASFEIIDLPLLRAIAETRKPVIISTGMADFAEIEFALNQFHGNQDVTLLHCISKYPCPDEEYCLQRIDELSKAFAHPVGLSDHTEGSFVATLAVAMGARVFEKHFTLDKTAGGLDDSFSADRDQLMEYRLKINKAHDCVFGNLAASHKEQALYRKLRKSLFFRKALKAGDVIKEGDIGSYRPGIGAEPKFYFNCIGKTLLVPVEFADPVNMDFFE